MNRKIIYIPILVAIALFVYACASYGPLGGGAKDVTPPAIVESTPVIGATQFNDKKVQIIFNEFITLKDIQKQFVVSPPMKKAPLVVAKPKGVDINFEEELKPNTTYTLYFGNSITDFTEGNPLRNFNFVFSTGDHIDSLSILGKVLNARDHTPDKDGMYVMLYPIDHDTIPRKTLPLFITKSDEKGWFKIDHIFADTFLIFGLKDANMNYMFDQPGEQIAFSDTLVVFDKSFYEKPDTSTHKLKLSKDSVKLELPKDTAKLDSTDFYAGKTPRIELFYFKEDVRKQRLNSSSRTKNNQFSLIFELPELDSVGLKLLNSKSPAKWWGKDNLLANDTINYWLTDTAIINSDSLKVQVSYYKLDSAGKSYLTFDTINLNMKLTPALKNRKTEQKKIPKRLTVLSSLSGSTTLDLNQKIFIEPDQPIQMFDPSKIYLSRTEDTLEIPVKFSIKKDSLFLRRYYIVADYQSDTQYHLVVDTAAFCSLFGVNSDSTGFSFKTQREDYYGTIKLTLKNVRCPTIVQLTTPKGDLVREKKIASDGVLLFDYLSQGKYGLKVIYDRNNNGEWDTGNWGKRIQPEKTLFYNNEISVRSSWDLDALWELPLK
jgi:hypothetical protein